MPLSDGPNGGPGQSHPHPHPHPQPLGPSRDPFRQRPPAQPEPTPSRDREEEPPQLFGFEKFLYETLLREEREQRDEANGGRSQAGQPEPMVDVRHPGTAQRYRVPRSRVIPLLRQWWQELSTEGTPAPPSAPSPAQPQSPSPSPAPSAPSQPPAQPPRAQRASALGIGLPGIQREIRPGAPADPQRPGAATR